MKQVDKTVKHGKVLAAHQKFMEDPDADKQAKHIIVLGLTEDDEEEADER